MITNWQTIIWQQFGAAIDMLENAICACPENVWCDRTRKPEYRYIVYHTVFFLDFYLSESEDKFGVTKSQVLELQVTNQSKVGLEQTGCSCTAGDSENVIDSQ